jgi:dTDP-4-amino-4,6-dideoxygalactose transaminase
MDKIMKVPFINLGLQYLKLRDQILGKFDEISQRGAYVLSPEVKEFEENFAEYCGTRFSVGVGCGADALFFSLIALGIGEGDEVITAPNSFVASAWAIANVGARPVFVDVCDDFNIDPEKIEAAITPYTKAIMPIHLTGRIAEMDRIMEIAKKHSLHVIEDAAQAVGATYKGKKAGAFGITGCFSLHPLKNLHVHGDGGMITTNNEELYNKLLKMRNHGLKNRDECEFWGYNSRLDGIQAAIGNIKLLYLDQWNQRFRKISHQYSQELGKYIQVPSEKEYEKPIYHRYIIRHPNRDQLQAYLTERGVETKVNYPIPLHLQKSAQSLGYKKGDFPNAEQLASTILSLPVYAELKDENVQYVINHVQEYVNQNNT